MPKRFYKINYQYFDDFIDMEQTHRVYVCAKNPKAATDIVKHHDKDFLCVLSLELVSAEEVGTSSFLTNDIQQAPEEKKNWLPKYPNKNTINDYYKFSWYYCSIRFIINRQNK